MGLGEQLKRLDQRVLPFFQTRRGKWLGTSIGILLVGTLLLFRIQDYGTAGGVLAGVAVPAAVWLVWWARSRSDEGDGGL